MGGKCVSCISAPGIVRPKHHYVYTSVNPELPDLVHADASI